MDCPPTCKGKFFSQLQCHLPSPLKQFLHLVKKFLATFNKKVYSILLLFHNKFHEQYFQILSQSVVENCSSGKSLCCALYVCVAQLKKQVAQSTRSGRNRAPWPRPRPPLRRLVEARALVLVTRLTARGRAAVGERARHQNNQVEFNIFPGPSLAFTDVICVWFCTVRWFVPQHTSPFKGCRGQS